MQQSPDEDSDILKTVIIVNISRACLDNQWKASFRKEMCDNTKTVGIYERIYENYHMCNTYSITCI